MYYYSTYFFNETNGVEYFNTEIQFELKYKIFKVLNQLK